MPYIFPTESIMSQLQNANKDYYGRKTWENLYGNIDLARQSEIGALQQDYSQSVLDTYESAYRAKQNVMASNLGQGYKLAGTSDIDLAAADAYEAFRQNYMSGASKVNQAYGEQTAAVTSALQSEAENYQQIATSPYEYLQNLFKTSFEGDDSKNPFLTTTALQDYVIRNAETNEYTLKTWDQLAAGGLFDEKGYITDAGTKFYNNIFNLDPSIVGTTYGTWLYENNPELYNWAMATNPYDFNIKGTNIGSFKELLGLEQTPTVDTETGEIIEPDEAEDFTILPEDETITSIANTVDEINKAIEDFEYSLTEPYTQALRNTNLIHDNMTTLYNMSDRIIELVDKTGLADAIVSELGLSTSETKTSTQILQEYFNKDILKIARGDIDAGDEYRKIYDETMPTKLELAKQAAEVNKDTSLTKKQKADRVQEIMSGRAWSKDRQERLDKAIKDARTNTYNSLINTYSKISNIITGYLYNDKALNRWK